jgi:hypothetical protein
MLKSHKLVACPELAIRTMVEPVQAWLLTRVNTSLMMLS